MLNSRPSIDTISTKLKTLEAEHESVLASLKESQAKEVKLKKNLEGKHVSAMAELKKNLVESKQEVESLTAQLNAADAEAKAIAKSILCKLVFLGSLLRKFCNRRI
jgi:uncharacterized protein (DUF3084 family)